MIRAHYVPLYQSIVHSRKMADLRVKDARFFYCALLAHCDAYGRMSAHPRVVYAKMWALFGTEEHARQCLDDLDRVGLVVRYEHDGEPVLAIPDWEEKAGRVGRPDRRGPETIPSPPSRGTTPADRVVDNSECGTTPASRARLDPSRAEQSQAEQSQAESAPSARAGKPRPRSKHAVVVVTLEELPEPLRTVVFQTTLAEFLEFRRTERGSPVTPIALRNLLLKLEPHGAAHAAASLRDSMANGWSGVFPEKRASGAPSPLQHKPGGMREWFAQQDAQQAPRTVDVEGGAL